MQFLKTLFWVIAAVIVVAFAHGNWSPVTINLWAGLILQTKLPVVVLGSILLGFLPTYALLRATRWRTKRRLENVERNAAPTVGVVSPPPPPFTVTEP